MPTLAERPKKRAASPATLGGDIDKLWSLREAKRGFESKIKEIEEEASLIEERLMENMKQQGIDKSTGKNASVSISTTTAANVEDWVAFYAYNYKNKFAHLLQRRVSDPAYRELLEQGKRVSGVQPFLKQRLNIRVVNS